MISGDYQLMFEDYLTGEMITLGGDRGFCSVRFDGIGSAELRANERDMPLEDGITFGREFLGKRMWTIQGGVKGPISDDDGNPIVDYIDSETGQPVYRYSGSVVSNPEASWNELAKLMRAWDFNKARKTSRDVLPLYFKRPGRETVIAYGRPERIDPDASQSYAGFVTYQASFRQSDPKMYSAESQVLSMSNHSPYVGGLLLVEEMDALILPFATSEVTETQGFVTVGGDIETTPVITIEGPAISPSVYLIGPSGNIEWTLTLNTIVGSSQTVVIDPRMWARTVLRNDGASLAGALNGPRMADMLVSPGINTFVYSSSGLDTTSTCTIELRNAWASV